jgi:hypothetical protein
MGNRHNVPSSRAYSSTKVASSTSPSNFEQQQQFANAHRINRRRSEFQQRRKEQTPTSYEAATSLATNNININNSLVPGNM